MSGEVHRSGQVAVVDCEQQPADLVLQADPGHVLPAVAESRAQSETEQWPQPGQHTAARGEHQTGAGQHNSGAGVLGGQRRGLPVQTEPG